MFRRKERRYLNSRGQHEIHIPASFAVDTGLVGDEADPFATQGREIVLR
jgi:hypothetical protein